MGGRTTLELEEVIGRNTKAPEYPQAPTGESANRIEPNLDLNRNNSERN